MTTPYDPWQVVTDGPITTARVLQHAIKAATSLAVFALLCLFDVPTLHAGVLAGPAFWLALAIYQLLRPSDPAHYTLAQHALDWITDCSLATIGGLVPALAWTGDWLGAALLGGGCLASYLASRHGARP